MLKIIYVYFDLLYAAYCGWEYRTIELLSELGVNVLPIPRHRCIAEGRLPIPKEADMIWVSNPMCLDVAIEIKERIAKPLAVQFLDVPRNLMDSEEWRLKEYEKVREHVKNADYITAISKSTAKDVEEWCGRKVDRVIYIGCDSELFESVKVSDKEYAITIPRGLAKQKNYQEAIEIAKGIVPLKTVWGQFSDVMKAKLLKNCSFGIHSSKFEGFCIPIVELNIARKPVIARELPVIKEIHEGNKGVMMYKTVHEAREFAKILVDDKKLRERLGKFGREFVLRRKLTLGVYAKRLKEFFEELK